MIPPERMSKIPRWARQEIERLTADLEYSRAKLAAGPDDSNTFADPYSKAPRPLGRDTTIMFVTTEGHTLRACLERNRVTGMYDRLSIWGDVTLAIRPDASNVCSIYLERRSG